MRFMLVPCVAVVAGCGVTDVMQEASALSAPIRVTAYHWASTDPYVGTEVLFIAPDQSVQTVITDVNGDAEALSPANTRVVVFQDEELNHPLVRVFDAANPGDHIIAGNPVPNWGGIVGSVSFVLPPRTGWNNAQDIYYMLQVSCSPDNGWWTVRTRDVRVINCPHATHASAVGWIEDGFGNLLTGPSVLRDIDLLAQVGQTVHMPAYEPKLTSVSAQFINVPVGTPQLQWQTAAFYGDDPTVFAYGSTYSATPDVVNTRPWLGVGDRTLSSLRFQPPASSGVNHYRFDTSSAPTYVVDTEQVVRPMSFPTFDVTTQTMHWTATPYGQPATFLRTSLTAGSRVRVEVYTAGDTTAVTLPELPAALTPQPSDQINAAGYFLRFAGETYSQTLQVASTRNPLNPFDWPASELSVAW